ncbi:MAG: HAD family hydrolase [Dehalococcoidia bacterium]|nr:HAD family hydrolase [Dehalococcoidia bacterium]
MTIRAVFFDVGGVLVNETRIYSEWAAWLGVSPFTFFGVLGAVIERRQHPHRAFEIIKPGFDLAAEETLRRAAGRPNETRVSDLFPDVADALAAVRAAGYLIGIAGNQPAAIEGFLQQSGLPADIIASSEGWGVEKPSPLFFTRVAEVAGLPPSEIAYVGDRVDNDVLPANAAGMLSVFLPRGPWGAIHAAWTEAAQARVRIESLADLTRSLRDLRLDL